MAKYNPRIHQTTPYTALDRYPDTFSAAASLLGEDADLRLLSFGCSTGEEVLTLRGYFPRATIIGADLDRARLRKCREKVNDPKIKFIVSNNGRIKALGPYDAVFAMAVLQRTPHKVHDDGIRDISRIYSFSKFNEQLSKFDSSVRVGGLIVIQNTQYRFIDSDIANKYEVCGYTEQPSLPFFDRNSVLIPQERYRETVFRKIR
ncbi:MAG: class I SAM-dependent methyltransferase [Pseudomonadota bacterium]